MLTLPFVKILLRTGVVLGLLCWFAAPARAVDWPAHGLDPARSRVTEERSDAAFATTGWSLVLPTELAAHERRILASPAMADGFVVVGTASGEVRGLREADGQPLWTVAARGPVTASPAIARGRVFVATEDGTLFGLRLADGNRLWRRELGSLVFASPTVVGDSLYIVTGNPNPRVLRLDPETGATVWETAAGTFKQALHAPPAAAGDALVVAEMDGRYHALALVDGAARWSVKLGGIINVSAPLIHDGVVYVGTGGAEARIHALAIGDGTVRAGWPVVLPAPDAQPGRRMVADNVLSSIVMADGMLIATHRFDEHFDAVVDGVADRFLARERLVVVDPRGTPALKTVTALGQIDAGSIAAMPLLGFAPTPAGYRAQAGGTLLAVASSVDGTARVFTLGSGGAVTEAWQTMLSGPTRSSPAFANGRLFVATDAGRLHALFSQANRPPQAPGIGAVPPGGRIVDGASAAVEWGTALDVDGGLARYFVRVDDDGELLESWDAELLVGAGQPRVTLSSLTAGQTYVVAVRAQDMQGALSAWSAPMVLRVISNPPVTIGEGNPTNLADALARAQPGQIITLGRGTYRIGEALRIPAGVSLAGAGPHLTTLDVAGLPVGVSPGTGSELRQLRIAGAEVGVEVAGATGVRLRNVILSDNTVAGLSVEPTGSAELVSATVARNAVGVRARGTTAVRNTLMTENDVGLAAAAPGLASTSYGAVFGNVLDWEGVEPDATDLAAVVAFEGTVDVPLLPRRAQPSTDRGDPADPFELEPTPNGGRINIGAYGNTPFAELSADDIPPAPDAGVTDAGAPADGGAADVMAMDAPPASEAGGAAPTPGQNPAASGCGCSLRATPAPGGPAALLVLALAFGWRLRRRR